MSQSSFASSSRASDSMISNALNGGSADKNVHTYEIVMRYLLKHIDISLMIVLYIAGSNRIDVYHMLLLIFFAIYIMYPNQFRKRFVWLLYFMIVIATFK
jgi:hypothetical protein